VNRSDRFRSQLSDGHSRDEALRELRRAASPMDCIKAMFEMEGVGLAEAQRLFLSVRLGPTLTGFTRNSLKNSRRWRAKMTPPVTIYVALHDEGVPVWRPVSAAQVGEDTYRILSANNEHADEIWEFDQGDLVRCVDRTLSGTPVKVAVARASSGAG
jgi:hypothetical protein